MKGFHFPGLAALALAGGGALAGCTTDGRGGAASLEDSVQPPSRMVALAGPHEAARSPLAALPAAAGAVAGVKSRGYVDGVRQDIALNGGAVRTIGNGITVLARTSRQQTLDEAVPLYKPTEGAIRSEIGAQFPHLPMQVVERPASNGYGPYGLALGRAPGNVHCAYMWQWIDANRLPRGGDLVGPASVRVRLCRADMSFDAMAAVMDQLVIAPAGAAPVPQGAAPSDLRQAAEPQVIVAADVAPEPREAEPDVAPLAAPAHRARRHRVAHRRPRPVVVDAVAVREAAPPIGDGPRYMSAVATAPSAAPQPAAPVLPADLPPQAYSGPTPHKTN